MNANNFTLCFWLLIVGLVSACSSGSDTSEPVNTPANAPNNEPGNAQETVEADSLSNDDPVIASTQQTDEESVVVQVESDPAESAPDPSNPELPDPELPDNSETVESVVQDANTDSQRELTVANNQSVTFGTAKLLVDLVPNGGSYPAKFHLSGDRLYFSTVDTDPRFANCAYHWKDLDDDDKSIQFNLVTAHPETGVVAMNRKIMTLGDFAEEPNYACAGYNGTIMQVYAQTWITPPSATGEQQFILHFDHPSLGPDRLWKTDGNAANTSLLANGQVEERLIFEGDKVFIVSPDGLSVSDTLTGNRRLLFESDDDYFFSDIKQIERSSARQATFEIRVGQNRYQIWTYDLDTDVWEKKFNIKPDESIYRHDETLMVEGETLLSRGDYAADGFYMTTLGISGNYGDVTSFENITGPAPLASNSNLSDGNTSFNESNKYRLSYSTIDSSVEPRVTSIWSYSDAQIEKLFSIPDSALANRQVITGYGGLIYVTGTKQTGSGSEYRLSLELWSYNPQTEQLVELSGDDWSAVIYAHSTLDDGYVFRYLNTPDGLLFVNLQQNTGRELWYTDGTSEGTRLLADINPGPGDSDPRNFYYGGDAIYFSANDGVHDREPWMIPISR